jgi:membrane-bound metal-dependent hydrolase YbcI (DUF457 family)
MPFTPYHLGPGSLIGLSLFKIFDVPALLIASVVIDIEPFSALLFNLNYPLHGVFHSFLGGSMVAGFIAAAVYFLKNDIKKLMVLFKLAQDSSFKKILWTSFFGIYFHILLDSPLYTDIKPFYPLTINPFYGLFSPEQIYLFSGLSFFVAILICLARLFQAQKS